MTADWTLAERLLLFLIERVNRLDIDLVIAEATGDIDAMRDLRRAHEELDAITSWAESEFKR